MADYGPMPHIKGGGAKHDTVRTGAVDALSTRMQYLKQIVTMLLGTAVGAPITKVVTGKQALAAGTTLVTATGSVFIKAVHMKKLTADETDIATLTLTSDDAVSLNLLLRKENDAGVGFGDFVAFGSRIFQVGWVLATGKTLKLVSDVDGQIAGYHVVVEAYALSEGASLA